MGTTTRGLQGQLQLL